MTTPSKSQVLKHLRDYVYNDIEPKAFDDWLCHTNVLETLFGPNEYFKLIDLDYSKKDEVQLSKDIATRIYGDVLGGDLERDRAKDALEGLLDGTRSPYAACTILSELRLNGADFVPAVFDGYASEFRDPKNLNHYQARLIADAQRLLDSVLFGVRSSK